MTLVPRVGEVILRPVVLTPVPGKGKLVYKKSPEVIEFGKAASGGRMIWACRRNDVGDSLVATTSAFGITCFIEGDVPADWTHMTVTWVGKQGKTVRVAAGCWDKQQLLDLFLTPNEEQTAHATLVKRVMEILREKPDLLPLQTLARRMSGAKLIELLGHWLSARTKADNDSRSKILGVVRELVVTLEK